MTEISPRSHTRPAARTRRICLLHLLLLAVTVAGAAIIFSAEDVDETDKGALGVFYLRSRRILRTISAYFTYNLGELGGKGSWKMLLFLGLVVVSRFGLYGFDLGILQLEQVRRGQRNTPRSYVQCAEIAPEMRRDSI